MLIRLVLLGMGSLAQGGKAQEWGLLSVGSSRRLGQLGRLLAGPILLFVSVIGFSSFFRFVVGVSSQQSRLQLALRSKALLPVPWEAKKTGLSVLSIFLWEHLLEFKSLRTMLQEKQHLQQVVFWLSSRPGWFGNASLSREVLSKQATLYVSFKIILIFIRRINIYIPLNKEVLPQRNSRKQLRNYWNFINFNLSYQIILLRTIKHIEERNNNLLQNFHKFLTLSILGQIYDFCQKVYYYILNSVLHLVCLQKVHTSKYCLKLCCQTFDVGYIFLNFVSAPFHIVVKFIDFFDLLLDILLVLMSRLEPGIQQLLKLVFVLQAYFVDTLEIVKGSLDSVPVVSFVEQVGLVLLPDSLQVCLRFVGVCSHIEFPGVELLVEGRSFLELGSQLLTLDGLGVIACLELVQAVLVPLGLSGQGNLGGLAQVAGNPDVLLLDGGIVGVKSIKPLGIIGDMLQLLQLKPIQVLIISIGAQRGHKTLVEVNGGVVDPIYSLEVQSFASFVLIEEGSVCVCSRELGLHQLGVQGFDGLSLLPCSYQLPVDILHPGLDLVGLSVDLADCGLVGAVGMAYKAQHQHQADQSVWIRRHDYEILQRYD